MSSTVTSGAPRSSSAPTPTRSSPASSGPPSASCYDVRLLGADLPVASITSAVARHRPAVVGFTSATVLTAVNLPAAFDAVRRVGRHIGIVVGGQGIAPEIAAGWDVAVCRHVADAVEQVDALVQRARRN
jgi:B12 binding protein